MKESSGNIFYIQSKDEESRIRLLVIGGGVGEMDLRDGLASLSGFTEDIFEPRRD